MHTYLVEPGICHTCKGPYPGSTFGYREKASRERYRVTGPTRGSDRQSGGEVGVHRVLDLVAHRNGRLQVVRRAAQAYQLVL